MGFKSWIIPRMYERCGTFLSLNGVSTWIYEWGDRCWKCLKNPVFVWDFNYSPIDLTGKMNTLMYEWGVYVEKCRGMFDDKKVGGRMIRMNFCVKAQRLCYSSAIASGLTGNNAACNPVLLLMLTPHLLLLVHFYCCYCEEERKCSLALIIYQKQHLQNKTWNQFRISQGVCSMNSCSYYYNWLTSLWKQHFELSLFGCTVSKTPLAPLMHFCHQ